MRLEYKTANWIANVVRELPPEGTDFAAWIQDGKILCRVLNELVFNSVPFDISTDISGDARIFKEERVKFLIAHIKQLGIKADDLFHTKEHSGIFSNF